MSLTNRLCRTSLPVVAAISLAASLVSTTALAANSPPEVVVSGAEAGTMRFASPVTIQGTARDQHGIKTIYGTIQVIASKKYITQQGQLSDQPSRLEFKYAKSEATRWASPTFNLPKGEYLFNIRVEDGKSMISPLMQVPFMVTASNMVAAPAKNRIVRSTQNQPKPAQQPAAVAQTPVKTAAVANVAKGGMAANGMAYCAAGAAADPDKDGFGWENNTSCVVAGSRADTHPNCASAASDPDGDGYGWENEKSCIVVTHCASAASDPDGDGFGWENNKSCIVIKEASKSRFARCAQGAASDPDGDGYGWENNKTCLVQ